GIHGRRQGMASPAGCGPAGTAVRAGGAPIHDRARGACVRQGGRRRHAGLVARRRGPSHRRGRRPGHRAGQHRQPGAGGRQPDRRRCVRQRRRTDHGDPEQRVERADPARHRGQRAFPRRAVTVRHVLLLAALLAPSAAAAAGAIDLRVPHGGGYSVPVTSLKEARFRATVRQQYDFSCGSAAVATLLTYQYGVPVDEAEVFRYMYATGDQARIRAKGFSLLDMRRYLASRGFTADGFQEPLDRLLEQGLPAIVLIDDRGYRHFVVVRGLRQGRVLVADPARGTRAIARRDFDRMWDNRLLFVVHNRRELASFNQARDWDAAPAAPLHMGIQRQGLRDVVIPRRGPGDIWWRTGSPHCSCWPCRGPAHRRPRAASRGRCGRGLWIRPRSTRSAADSPCRRACGSRSASNAPCTSTARWSWRSASTWPTSAAPAPRRRASWRRWRRRSWSRSAGPARSWRSRPGW